MVSCLLLLIVAIRIAPQGYIMSDDLAIDTSLSILKKILTPSRLERESLLVDVKMRWCKYFPIGEVIRERQFNKCKCVLNFKYVLVE